MNQSNIKSTLEIQRTKSDLDYFTISHTVGKYQKNLELVKSGTSAAEKTLFIVIMLNVLLAFSLLVLNHVNTMLFNKDYTLYLLSQFNIFLPLFISIPVTYTILKNFISDKNTDRKICFSILGKIVGTATILTLIPFVSIIISYLLKSQLI